MNIVEVSCKYNFICYASFQEIGRKTMEFVGCSTVTETEIAGCSFGVLLFVRLCWSLCGQHPIKNWELL